MRTMGALAGMGLMGLMLVTNGWANASADTGNAGDARAAGPSVRPLAGSVVRIDRKDNTLTLDNGAQIQIDSAAQFTKDGHPAWFADIRPGDEVRASFAQGSNVLHGFTVSTPPASKFDVPPPPASTYPAD